MHVMGKSLSVCSGQLHWARIFTRGLRATLMLMRMAAITLMLREVRYEV